jgi:hypothetical protein
MKQSGLNDTHLGNANESQGKQSIVPDEKELNKSCSRDEVHEHGRHHAQEPIAKHKVPVYGVCGYQQVADAMRHA